MEKMTKMKTGRVVTAAVLTMVMGVLLWALIAYAAAAVGTYSSNTYATSKTEFGRGVDTVYTKMTAGLASKAYIAEYWGPSVDDGTDLVQWVQQSPAATDASGVGTSSYATQATDKAGSWQVRMYHNPRFLDGSRVQILGPTPGVRLTASTSYSFQCRVLDREGNVVLTDLRTPTAYLYMRIYNGNTRIVRANIDTTWAFNTGTGVYSKSYSIGTGTNSIVYFRVTSVNGYAGVTAEAAPGVGSADAYIMGSLYTQENWWCGTGTPTASIMWTEPLAPTTTYNQFKIANPPGGPKYPAVDYTYVTKLFNSDGTEVTSGSFTWTRTAVEADDYDGNAALTTYTGTAPVYDGALGGWKTIITLPAPGKYRVRMSAVSTATCYVTQVVNYAASVNFTMLGDVTPPAEVSGLSSTPTDNRNSLSWTNPGDADFQGVLILRNTQPITQTPTMGQVYDPYGVGGPNTIGTSNVVLYDTSLGTTFVNGDPCVPAQRLVNGQLYYYKVFTFDNLLNYSAGSQLGNATTTPVDTVAPTFTQANAGFNEGNQEIEVVWNNPDDCDFAGVRIRYKTDSWPTAYDGSDGSYLAGDKLGGTPGVTDTFLHTNRVNGTPYFYTIWSYDDETAKNVSAPLETSYYAVPHDVTSPDAVNGDGVTTGLRVIPGSVEAFNVTLQWESTGDDGITGNATAYEIRYSNSPIITETDWDNAWHTVGANLPQPLPSGTTQSYLVAGLAPMTQYYFAIKVADESQNTSPVSNSPDATTLCNPEISACNQCHLMPPDDDLPGAHPRGTGNIGAHYLPIHAGGGDASQCNVCHANGEVWRNNTTLYKFTHQNDQIDLNGPGKIGNESERISSTGGTFFMETTIVYKYKNYSSGVAYKQMTGYCQNTYCHGAGLSSPRWGLEGIVCGEYCHETPPATGRHVKHYHPGQHYVNFGPGAQQVSGYTNDDGSAWTGSVTAVDRGNIRASGGNEDERYSTFISSTNATETFTLPDGMWYITVCVGDSASGGTGGLSGQTVKVSGNGGTTWDALLDNFQTLPEKLYKKVVDHEVLITGGNNLMIQIGNGSVPTALDFIIINATPEAPKANTTLLQNTPTEYGFACGKCHTVDLTQSKHTSHVDGSVQLGVRDAQVAFDGNSFPKNPLGSYTQIAFYPISSRMDGQGFNYTNNRSCINTYCHGSTLNAGGSNPSPQWKDGYIDVGGASLCGACHDGNYADTTPFTAQSTGSHKKHVTTNYAYRIDCYKCHYHTTGPKEPGTGVIPITDKTHHVNGDVDAVFDPNDNTMKFGRYSTAEMTCYNVYCHSNGLLNAANEPYWATTYREPVWASGAKTCNYCHGTSRPDGMPSYANLSSRPNSHEAHVDGNGLGCAKCHHDTTRDGLTVYTAIQPTLHVDGGADVTFDEENPSATYNNSNLQCSNTYCHGLTAPPTWGGVATCGSCHGQSPTNPNPGVGAHNAHNAGNHGNISTANANKSTALQYDFDCRFCHFSRTHAGGEIDPGVQSAETNFNTIDVTNGYNNTGGVYTPGASRTDANGWHYTVGTCTNKCHSDGRGGSPNNTFYTWTSTTLGTNCEACHDGTSAAVNRIATGSHATHVWNSIYAFKCGDCHSTTCSMNNISNKANHVDGEFDVQPDAVWGGSYNDANKTCDTVGCHFNGDPTAWGGQLFYVQMNWTSVLGSNCTSCHSDNHNDAGDGVRTGPQTLSHNHAEHLNSVSQSGYGARFGCKNCHEATATSNTTLAGWMPTNHNNNTKDLYFTVPFMNMTGPNTLANFTTTGEPKLGYWGGYNQGGVIGKCTVICHSNGLGGDPARFPNWSTPETSYGCGSCHGDKATLTTGSHAKHLNGNIGCSICHRKTAGGDAVSPFVNASGFSAKHVNGAKDVSVATAYQLSGTTVYSGGVCNATTCHGAGNSPVWGSGTTNCASCHASPPRYAQHFAHFSSTTLPTFNGAKNESTATMHRFACGKCHTPNGGSAIHHAQGFVSADQAAEVAFDTLSAPANGSASYVAGALMGTDAQGFKYTAGTCSNTYCHSNGRGTPVSIAWNVASVSCTSCHGGPAVKASVTLGGSHPQHVGTDKYSIGCMGCHDHVVSSNTVVSDKSRHVNGAKNVNFPTFGTMTGAYTGTNTCRSNYCHSNGAGGAAGTDVAWGTTVTCTTCHKYTAGANEIITGKHKEHINNAGDVDLAKFRCVDCHVRTVTFGNNTVIMSPNKHVNATKDVYFKSFNSYTGAMTGTKTCRNNYCHSSGQATPTFRTTAAWDSATTYGCADCHGADGGWAAVAGEPNYANVSTSNRNTFNGHQKHVLNSSDCFDCHANSVSAASDILSTGRHLNGFRNVSFTQGGSYNATTKRCSNTACHGTAVMRWGGALVADCQSCHSDQGAGTWANHSSTGKHKKHSDSTTYKYACEVCHATINAATNIAHGEGDVSANQAAEVIFHSASTVWRTKIYGNGGNAFRYKEMDAALGTTMTPGYVAGTLAGSDPVNVNRKWTNGTCSNVWCHSSGTSTPSYVNPTWNGAAVTCTTCHGDKTTLTTNKHAVHINAPNLGNLGCADCHKMTVSADTTVSTYANHVNGTRNVSFKAFNSYTGGMSGTLTCRNNYCHSSGQATPAFRTTAAWTAATNNGCDDCHGSEGASYVSGAPEYANVTTAGSNANNSHYVTAHVSGTADCFRCHANTVASDGTTILSTGKHINGFRNVSFTLGGTYNTGTKTCTNTDAACHGASAMRWGSTATCQTCHQVTAAETDNFNYGDATKGTVNFYEYTSVGHGKKGIYRYTAQAGANLSCESSSASNTVGGCHRASTPHNATGNPFRLVSSATIKPTVPNSLCATTCHTSPAVQNHVKAITGGTKYTTWFFTPKCVDCHDPHGDSGGNDTTQRNYMMVQSFVNYSTGSNTYGAPYPTATYPRRAMDFPAETTRPASLARSSFVTATYDGICQICHRRNSGVVFTRSANAAHNGSTNCTDCHTAALVHDKGFQGAGSCTGCHGTGGAGVVNGRRSIQADFEKASHHIVASWASIVPADCAKCHAEGNSDGSINGTYHTQTAAQPIDLNVYGTYPTVNNVINYKAFRNNSSLTRHCLGCHNDTNKAATPFSDTRTPNTYAWDYNAVGAKWSNTGTTPWGKFNSKLYNVVPADLVAKAYSPHGNATANERVVTVAETIGTSGADSPASSNMSCYDCHNSHGSTVTGGTSYTSGNTAGGIFINRSTTRKYAPAGGGSSGTKNVYAADADLCFDCHMGDDATAPKTYTTYGLTSGQRILGYYERVGTTWTTEDATRWSTADTWRGTFPYKDGTFKGGHFGNSRGYLQSGTPGTAIGGQCVKCHDPHGVATTVNYTVPVRTFGSTVGGPVLSGTYSGPANESLVYVLQIVAGGAKGTATYRASANGGRTWATTTTTSADYVNNGITAAWAAATYTADDTWTWQAGLDETYMVPALKGTWMHSPYKEDRAPRSDYTTDTTGGTARLTGLTNADDYTTYNPALSTARRLWDDSVGGTSSTTTNRDVGAPAPRGNPDFRTGSYVPGFNIPLLQGDGFGRGGQAVYYGYTSATAIARKGWNGYYIDENTFGTTTLKNYNQNMGFKKMSTVVAATGRAGNFAGLCFQCHAWQKNSGIALLNVTTGTLGTGTARRQPKPHETVAGMANGTAGTIAVDVFARNVNPGSTQRPMFAMHNMTYNSTDGGLTPGPGTPAGDQTNQDPTSGPMNIMHRYRWGVSGTTQQTAGTLQAFYHRFPCSKCHTPHVSRLPRLMKTNCLDNDNVGVAHTTMAYYNQTAVPGTNGATLPGAMLRNVACHSTKIGSQNGSNAMYPGGWNNKTPW
ncbi:MAG: CxxxxCH/CxxCH domain-containing protein [Nitrospirae bacterium]|nr:CxxxxCH/CxxCH domain-containing protein [Nitrospirota bacterium]